MGDPERTTSHALIEGEHAMLASVEFLSLLITVATVMTTVTLFVLIYLVIRDWRRGTLW